MLLPSFRAFDVVVNGLPGAPKAGTLLLPVRRKKVAQMNGDNVRAYGADDSPSSWDDRRTAERSFDRSSDRYVDRSSDRYVERRDARSRPATVGPTRTSSPPGTGPKVGAALPGVNRPRFPRTSKPMRSVRSLAKPPD